MKRVLYTFKLFLAIFFKDRFNLFMIFFFNAFLMIIFGVSMQDKFDIHPDVGISFDAKEPFSNSLRQKIGAQHNIVVKDFKEEKTMTEELKAGKLVAAIVIHDKNIKLIGDPSRKMWLEFLKPVIEISTIDTAYKSSFKIETRLVNSRNLRFFDFFFPGILIFSVMQIGLSGGIMLLVQRKAGSLKRLQITPLEKWEFLTGYISCYMCIMAVQVIGYILLARLLFSYQFSGDLLGISLIIFLSSLLFIQIGILLCNFCNTVENGNNFNRFFTFPASFACGVFIPISTLPSLIQKAALVHPLTYLVEIMRDLANYNGTIYSHKLILACLVLLLVLTTLTSIRTFKWKEKI